VTEKDHLAEELVPLNPNDEVYIKSLNMLGKVQCVRLGDIREPEKERLYEVQIRRFIKREDLELYNPRVAREKREASLREKLARMQEAQNRLEAVLAAGGDVSLASATEFLVAKEDVWAEFGHKSVLDHIKGDSTK
jgi:hypothetical protein